MKIICYICKKPVDISEARSGIDGKPCHGQCFIDASTEVNEYE